MFEALAIRTATDAARGRSVFCGLQLVLPFFHVAAASTTWSLIRHDGGVVTALGRAFGEMKVVGWRYSWAVGVGTRIGRHLGNHLRRKISADSHDKREIGVGKFT